MGMLTQAAMRSPWFHKNKPDTESHVITTAKENQREPIMTRSKTRARPGTVEQLANGQTEN